MIATALGLALCSQAQAQESGLQIATTTSLVDSGFFSQMELKIEAATGLTIKVASMPTSRALASAARGDASIAFINDPQAGADFLRDGDGASCIMLMRNEFLILGPAGDPAGIADSEDAPAALREIAKQRAPFVSRGDRSGTHAAEMALWEAASVNPKARTGGWYRETGLGMGDTVATAGMLDAYVFTDSATWLKLRDEISIVPIFRDSPAVVNQYLMVTLDRNSHPEARHRDVATLVRYLTSSEGQAEIAGVRIDGEPGFVPNAGEGDAGCGG